MRNFFVLFVIAILSSCVSDKEEGPIVMVDAVRFQEIRREYKGAMLVDLRTPEEYSAGRLSGAVNIDFREDEFLHKLHQLSTRQVYIIYCDDGKRSREAAGLMEQLYFKQVYVLKNGLKQTDFKLIQ
jgi:rhodanese-related sulfurtransferase